MTFRILTLGPLAIATMVFFQDPYLYVRFIEGVKRIIM
jgi:hypothetical protein